MTKKPISASYMHHNQRPVPASLEHRLRDIGATLATARLARDLSQSDLARQTGTSRATINRLETGQSTSLETFVRVLAALEMLDAVIAALPTADVRPVERVRLKGRERQRAGRTTAAPKAASAWAWGEDAE
jgi:transcriptional regulator with XRE-family HTH domain